MTQQLTGTGVALVTPFNEKLQIDFEGLQRLLHLLSESDLNYFVVHGTTGESSTTTSAEKAAILAFILAHNPKKLPIVYGLGGNNTYAVLKTIENTDFQGIDAILTASPYYNKPSQEGIYRHYKMIADACPVPILLYNVPSRTGINMQATTTLRLSAHPNIIGIKEASGDLLQCMEITQQKAADFMVISGDDMLTVPLMAMGGVGVISTLANGFPAKVGAMVNAALQGNYVVARAHTFELLKIFQLLWTAGNPVGAKQILEELGICKHYVRLPLVPASAAFANQVQALLAQTLP